MIKSFKDKHTEGLFSGQRVSKFEYIAHRAQRKLRLLEAASDLRALNLPSNRLKKLSGDREGQYSIRVNDQWRICFEWREDGAYNVEVVDYH